MYSSVALGLGRSDDSTPKDSDYGEWDSVAVDTVTSSVGSIVEQLRALHIAAESLRNGFEEWLEFLRKKG